MLILYDVGAEIAQSKLLKTIYPQSPVSTYLYTEEANVMLLVVLLTSPNT